MRPPEEAASLAVTTVERIRRANIDDRDCFIRLVHQSVDIEGIESVFQRITERDDEALVDHLMEIRYGVLFKDHGFRPRFEPAGAAGPDLMVERDGLRAFVEVKRYRPKEGEDIPESWGPNGTLMEYGDPGRTQLRIEKDLLCKLRQVEPRNGVEHGILAIWSDRKFFENVEFECAVRRIAPEAAKKGVRFCLFGWDWQRFYCEPVSLPKTFRSWMEDLQGAPK